MKSGRGPNRSGACSKGRNALPVYTGSRISPLARHGGLDTPWRFAGSTGQWFAEGRLFLDMLDMIDNNYLGVTGLRMLWKDNPPADSGNTTRSR